MAIPVRFFPIREGLRRQKIDFLKVPLFKNKNPFFAPDLSETPNSDLPGFLFCGTRPMSSSSSWSCPKCTFINATSHEQTCQICLSPKPSSPSSTCTLPLPSQRNWSCKACTFLNPRGTTRCEICGTADSPRLLSSLDGDDEFGSCVGDVFFPLRACSGKRKNVEQPVGNGGAEVASSSNNRRKMGKESDDDEVVEITGIEGVKAVYHKEVAPLGKSDSGMGSRTLKILSYNVWFREDLEMHKRMKALGDLIQLHSPDVICLQEVTPNIYETFQQSSWWKAYCCSVSSEMASASAYFCMQLSKLPVKSFMCKPFSNSIMGRELCVAEVVVQKDMTLVIATSHLESPCPGPPKWDQMFSKERVEQAKEALKFLEKKPNVIFCGDMNWDDKLDGQFPFPDGWFDAWSLLRSGENGWTYDTKSNKMLSGNRSLQKRLDRFICKLQDFKASGIEMIGTDAIPGLSYCKEKKVRNEVKQLILPVLPSDHYGLLFTVHPN